MNYIKISFNSGEQQLRDILVASLAEMDFEGFEEEAETLHAYIPEDKMDGDALSALAERYAVPFAQQVIPRRNWNAQWEAGFRPVIIPGFCTVRAAFHDIPVTTPHELVITPKMSFGTGHHDTTLLMMEQMRDHDFREQQVLDFGTGTGILAILAARLGAATVHGIDNDEWSYENAQENAAVNQCSNVTFSCGSLEAAAGNAYDVILANINRHILLAHLHGLYRSLKKGGRLLMSGVLESDAGELRAAAAAAGFDYRCQAARNGWLVMAFEK